MTLDVASKRGKRIVLYGAMHTGKTKIAIGFSEALEYSKYNVLACTNNINKRDGPTQIVSNGTLAFPAHCIDVNNPEEILYLIDEKYKSGEPIDVVVISEANFYDHRLVQVVKKITDINSEHPVLAIIEGIHLTFRNDIFGPMGKLIEISDEAYRSQGYCTAHKDGERCSDADARYNARVLKIDETGFDPLFDELAVFYKKNKDGKTELVKGFKFAPYFDETLRTEPKKDEDANFGYVNVCKKCMKLPGKDLCADLMDFIQKENGAANKKLISNYFNNHSASKYIGSALEFLVNEHRAVFDNGKISPTMYIQDPGSEMFIPRPGQNYPKVDYENKLKEVYSFSENGFIEIAI